MAEYIITDGSRFIFRNHSGKYVPVQSEVMADIFNKKQAERILSNSLPKALRTTFYVEKYDKPSESIKQVTKKELENNTEKVMISENIQKWLDRISDLNGLAKEAQNRKEELIKQLHKIEDELLDIEHYIEFSNLNAAQGYKASNYYRAWEYSNGEKVSPQLYRRGDLNTWAEEARKRGENGFFAEPVDLLNPYGELRLCDKKYHYQTTLKIEINLYEQWINGEFTKCVLQAKNRNKLLKAKTMAEELGMKEGEDFWLIMDNCHTEIEPEEDGRTLTVIGFKPMDSEIIDQIGRKYHFYM